MPGLGLGSSASGGDVCVDVCVLVGMLVCMLVLVEEVLWSLTVKLAAILELIEAAALLGAAVERGHGLNRLRTRQ